MIHRQKWAWKKNWLSHIFWVSKENGKTQKAQWHFLKISTKMNRCLRSHIAAWRHLQSPPPPPPQNSSTPSSSKSADLCTAMMIHTHNRSSHFKRLGIHQTSSSITSSSSSSLLINKYHHPLHHHPLHHQQQQGYHSSLFINNFPNRNISTHIQKNNSQDSFAPPSPIHSIFNFEQLVQRRDEMIENIKLRELQDSINVDEIIQLYQEYIQLESKCEHVQFLRREIAEYLAGKRTLEQLPSQIVEQSQNQSDLTNKKSDFWKDIGKQYKTLIQSLEKDKTNRFNALQEKAVKLPNFTHPQVMNYCKENSNQPRLIKYIHSNEEEEFNKTTLKLSHYEICERLNLFEPANECSGPKFFFLKNEGVLLEIALQNFALSKLLKKGFKIVMPPELMKQHIVEGCGFQPRGEHSQIYRIENSDSMNSDSNDPLCLIGTSEIGLAALHANKVLFLSSQHQQQQPSDQQPQHQNHEMSLNDATLTTITPPNHGTTTNTSTTINSTTTSSPFIKYAGLSHCFRTEAGAAGAKDRGLYRVHQFTKVEMFIYCTPDKSEELLEEIIQIQEEIFSELGLCFQILDMPCNDLGNPAHRKIDMEAYIPSRGGFGEVSSASNCTDYQSRKLNIRYKVDFVRFKSFYPHTLNGTAIAVPRAMIAILEKNQFYDEETGKLGVRIPECLHPFMLNGAKVIMEK